ncbi:hypothetical protein Tco_1335365 [Tanacetum coccineum]
MGGYKHKQLKGKSHDEIQKLFDKEMKRVNTFVAMGSEAQEGNKVEGSEEKATGSRKKSLDDSDELKKHLVIKKDDDIAIDVIPLATKPPVIVDYKLHKEGLMAHYELIRADVTSRRYTSMIRLLQGIDREDLQTLWKLVKTKHDDIRPEDEHERVLWGDLKVMFKPDIKSDNKKILWNCGIMKRQHALSDASSLLPRAIIPSSSSIWYQTNPDFTCVPVAKYQLRVLQPV